MQSRPSQREAIAVTGSETYQTLLERAHRRTGRVAPEMIVRHVLSVTRGGDWPLYRDVLDAVLRRCACAHTDEIRIVGRPRHRRLRASTVTDTIRFRPAVHNFSRLDQRPF